MNQTRIVVVTIMQFVSKNRCFINFMRGFFFFFYEIRKVQFFYINSYLHDKVNIYHFVEGIYQFILISSERVLVFQ